MCWTSALPPLPPLAELLRPRALAHRVPGDTALMTIVVRAIMADNQPSSYSPKLRPLTFIKTRTRLSQLISLATPQCRYIFGLVWRYFPFDLPGCGASQMTDFATEETLRLGSHVLELLLQLSTADTDLTVHQTLNTSVQSSLQEVCRSTDLNHVACEYQNHPSTTSPKTQQASSATNTSKDGHSNQTQRIISTTAETCMCPKHVLHVRRRQCIDVSVSLHLVCARLSCSTLPCLDCLCGLSNKD